MLARNHLSAEALAITQEELEALLRLRGALERGEIPASEFGMDVLWHKRWCGTVGCLLGWARHLAGDAEDCTLEGALLGRLPKLFANCGHQSPAISDLFMISSVWCGTTTARFMELRLQTTREQALQALNNYLTTGSAQWGQVLGTLP